MLRSSILEKMSILLADSRNKKIFYGVYNEKKGNKGEVAVFIL